MHSTQCSQEVCCDLDPAQTVLAVDCQPALIFIVAEQGTTCAVSAQALDAAGAAIEGCSTAFGMVEITAGETTEVLLGIICREPDSGSSDVIVVVDQAPSIDQLVVSPGQVAMIGEPVQIAVDAADPDGDELSYTFTATPPEVDSVYELTFDDARAVFRASTIGDYLVTVVVSDGWATTRAELTITVRQRN